MLNLLKLKLKYKIILFLVILSISIFIFGFIFAFLGTRDAIKISSNVTTNFIKELSSTAEDKILQVSKAELMLFSQLSSQMISNHIDMQLRTLKKVLNIFKKDENKIIFIKGEKQNLVKNEFRPISSAANEPNYKFYGYKLPKGAKVNTLYKKQDVFFILLFQFSIIQKASKYVKTITVSTNDHVLITYPLQKLQNNFDFYKTYLYQKHRKNSSNKVLNEFMDYYFFLDNKKNLIFEGGLHGKDGKLKMVISIEMDFNLLLKDIYINIKRMKGSQLMFIMRNTGIILASSYEVEKNDNFFNLFKIGDNFFDFIPASPNYIEAYNKKDLAYVKNKIISVKNKGEKFYISFVPISGTDGYFGLVQPSKNLLFNINLLKKQINFEKNDILLSFHERFKREFTWILIYLFLIVFAVVLLGIYFSKKITDPLALLEKWAEKIGEGDLDYRVDIKKTGDELEIFADTFTDMSNDIKHYINDIKKSILFRKKIEYDISTAANIQLSMLPKKIYVLPQQQNKFEVYASIKPAKTVAGDFYDYFFIDDKRLFFAIGDVSGKGIPASLFMMCVKVLLKNLVFSLKSFSLSEILYHLNNGLARDNFSCMFVTLFCGVLDIHTGKVTYISAAHEPPLIFRNNKKLTEFLKFSKNTVIGPIKNLKFNESELLLENDDILFMYTDGISEARNVNGDYFTRQAIEKCFNNNTDNSIKDIVKNVSKDVKEFTEDMRQKDDMTMLIIKKL